MQVGLAKITILDLVQRGGDWTGPLPAHLLLAVPNVTFYPSTASVQITVLLCGFNVGIKGLKP